MKKEKERKKNLEATPLSRREFLFYCYIFSIGRSAINAPLLWNFKEHLTGRRIFQSAVGNCFHNGQSKKQGGAEKRDGRILPKSWSLSIYRFISIDNTFSKRHVDGHWKDGKGIKKQLNFATFTDRGSFELSTFYLGRWYQVFHCKYKQVRIHSTNIYLGPNWLRFSFVKSRTYLFFHTFDLSRRFDDRSFYSL